jgi:hypothetical protein
VYRLDVDAQGTASSGAFSRGDSAFIAVHVPGDAAGNPCDADDDGDGFHDDDELSVGTDPLLACGPTAWPPDFDDNQTVNLLDMLPFKPHFGATNPSDPKYDPRYDLNTDGAINLLDLLPFKPVFRLSCTP